MKTITFSHAAIRDLDEWKSSDPKILAKIISLITEVADTPFYRNRQTGTIKTRTERQMVTTYYAGTQTGL